MNWVKKYVNGTDVYWTLTLRPANVDPDSGGFIAAKCVFIRKWPYGYAVFRAIPGRDDVGVYETLAAAKEAGEIAAIEWELEGLDDEPSEIQTHTPRGVLWKGTGVRSGHHQTH